MSVNSESIYLNSRAMICPKGFLADARNSSLEIKYHYEGDGDAFQELSLPFRISFIGRSLYRAGAQLSRTPTCTFDILYLYSGKITLSYHGHDITATQGDTILIQPDLPYVVLVDSHEPADILLISHYGESSWTYFNLLARHRVQVLRHHNPEALHPLIEKISFYMKYSFQLNLVLAVNYLVGLFTELYIGTQDREEYDRAYGQPHWLLSALNFLEHHYQRKLTVDEIASHCGMSVSHFNKLFKEYTQLSPYDYLMQIRIKKAKILLESTDDSIKQVAYRVGYPSVNHFISRFREQFGITPQQYRNKQQFLPVKTSS